MENRIAMKFSETSHSFWWELDMLTIPEPNGGINAQEEAEARA